MKRLLPDWAYDFWVEDSRDGETRHEPTLDAALNEQLEWRAELARTGKSAYRQCIVLRHSVNERAVADRLAAAEQEAAVAKATLEERMGELAESIARRGCKRRILCPKCGPEYNQMVCPCTAFSWERSESLARNLAAAERVVEAARVWAEAVEAGFASTTRPDVARRGLVRAIEAYDKEVDR